MSEVNLDDSDEMLLLMLRTEGIGVHAALQSDLQSLWGMAVAGVSMRDAQVSMRLEIAACRGLVN